MDANHIAEERSRAVLGPVVLGAGVLVALGLGLGGVWLARIGIVVAAVAGLVALLVVLRRLRTERSAAELAAQRSQRRALDTERRHHAESMGIIDRFTRRVADLRSQIEALQAEVAVLNRQLGDRDRLVASMRSTQESLLANAVEMRHRIGVLEQQIAVREGELRDALARIEQQSAIEAGVQTGAQEPRVAEILELPRRPQLPPRPADDEFVVWVEAAGQ